LADSGANGGSSDARHRIGPEMVTGVTRLSAVIAGGPVL
jgi:hypothetical protein